MGIRGFVPRHTVLLTILTISGLSACNKAPEMSASTTSTLAITAEDAIEHFKPGAENLSPSCKLHYFIHRRTHRARSIRGAKPRH